MGGRRSVGYPVTLGLVSAASMALEIVAGRALAPYVGMSLYSWTVIIAVVLAGLSFGHWIGGLLADFRRGPRIWVAASLIGAAVTAFASLAMLRLAEPLAGGLDPISHVSVLAMAAFFAPSTLAGMLAPLLTRMALDEAPPERQGRVLGLMFAMGAFGAILGTLVAGLVLISWVGTSGSVLIIAIAYAVLSLGYLGRRGRSGLAVLLIAAGGAAALAPVRFGLATPCAEESAYFCIRVDDIAFLGRPARVMALDHLAHGVNDRADPGLLLTPYVQGVDEIVRTRFPGPAIEAFFIGGGAYSLPRAWLAAYPEGRLVTAELDPAVTRMAVERLWLPEDPRHRVIHSDARQALAGLPPDERFDVIFGDAFHDISVPAHLVTDEFNQLVASRLKPGGIYALNIVDGLREPRFLLSLANTLRRRFEAVALWLDAEALAPGDRRTTWIVIASDTPGTADRLQARSGFQRQWVRVPLDAMTRAVGPETIITLTDDFAPVDRLLAPLILTSEGAEAGG